jgi:hypothetical protein
MTDVPNTIQEKVTRGLHDSVVDLLKSDFDFVSGERIQNMFADEIEKLVHKCYKDPWKMEVGQVLWYGAEKGEKPSYGKNARRTRMVPVVLTVINKDDLDMKVSGFSSKEIRRKKVERLFNEACDQGGVLTHADVATLLNVSTGTIGKDVKTIMEETQKIVPTRGIMHDIGRTITHKRLIVGLYLDGYQTPDIARKTNHTEEACDRYIKAFKKVKKLSKRMGVQQVANILDMGPSLVKEYIAILKRHEESGGK